MYKRGFQAISSLLVLFAIGITNCNAMQFADSLINIYTNEEISDSIRFKAINDYYKKTTYAQPDSVLKLTYYHVDLAIEKDDKSEISKAYNERAYAYSMLGDVEKAKEALLKAIKVSEQLDNYKGLAIIYSNLGSLYGAEGKYQEALSNFHNSLDIFIEENLDYSQARMYCNIGIIYQNVESYDLALEYLNKGMDKFKSIGQEKMSGSILQIIGLINYNQEKYEDAIRISEESIPYLQETNNKSAESIAYLTIAMANHEMGNNDNAKYYLERSLEISQSLNNKSEILKRLIFEARLNINENARQAIDQGEEILSQLNILPSVELKAKIYDVLYLSYKAEGMYDKSLEMFELKNIYEDSLRIQKDKTEIMREAIQHDFEKRMAEKDRNNEKERVELQSNYRNNTIAFSFIALLIIGIILYYNYFQSRKHKQKQADLIKEIDRLKTLRPGIVSSNDKFSLNREKIDASINRKLNETDWNVLSILFEEPVISNKELANRAHMSIDGIGSSLRRMYEYFDIEKSRYMKIALIMKAIKISG